jgi:tetratricopeptide (TPR) repeat protein
MRGTLLPVVLTTVVIAWLAVPAVRARGGATPGTEAPPVTTPAGGAAARASSATEQGVALYEQLRYPEAKILLGKAVALDAEDARAQAYLGMVLLHWDADIRGATAHLERATRLDPGNPRYHQWLGEAYTTRASSASQFEVPALAAKTRTELEKAVALGPEDLDARMALLQFYLSVPASLGGSDAKAEEQALAMTGVDRYRGLVAQGVVAEHEKETARAEQLYRTAIATDRTKGEAFNALGYMLLGQKRRKEAIAVFREYVAATPHDANAHDSLAEGLLDAGQVNESIEEYERALAVDPRFASSFLGLAKCYEAKRRWPEAIEALRRFLEIVPNGPKADEARDTVGDLQARKQ